MVLYSLAPPYLAELLYTPSRPLRSADQLSWTFPPVSGSLEEKGSSLFVALSSGTPYHCISDRPTHIGL